MSDQNSTNTTPPIGAGAGKWADRARLAAARRAKEAAEAGGGHAPGPAPETPAETPAEARAETRAERASTAGPAPEAPHAAAAAPSEEQVRARKRRFFSRPDARPDLAPTEPSTGRGVNPLLEDAYRSPGKHTATEDDDLDEGDVSEGRGSGLRSRGLGHTTGPVDPPVAPAPLNPAVRVPESWPIAPAPSGPDAAQIQLVGLHGGAGTSTLAAEIGPAALDCGVGLDALVTTELPVLFVTRSHARGLDLALRLGQQYAARSLDPLMILGVCVVEDAPTLTKGLARILRSVQKSLPNCWTVAWDEDLRHDPALPAPATRGRLARDIRRMLRKATALRESTTTEPSTNGAHTHA